MAILDPLGNILRFFTKKKKNLEPRMVEHRGMKVYMSQEIIDAFEKEGIDYEKSFREAVDELLDQEEDGENPYL